MEKTSGFLLVDKPEGWTSFDVCAKLRKILGTKKIGHTGTLDPFATGLLLVAFGKATRLIPFLEKDKKTYRTKILLGKTSETLDPTSEIYEDCVPKVIYTRERLEKVLHKNFLGKILQVPPKYSALKLHGARAYQLARQGKEFEIPARGTEIFEVRILAYDFPEITLKLTVSAGFYVRSFARDLAEKLGTSGLCAALCRMGIGKIEQNDENKTQNMVEIPTSFGYETFLVVTEQMLKNGIESGKNILSHGFCIDPKVLIDLPVLEIPGNRLEDFACGRAFFCSDLSEKLKENGGKVLVSQGGETIGIGEVIGQNLAPKISLLKKLA